MALFIYDQFLKDLQNEGDAKFPRRVLSKVIDSNANFVSNSEDHRYSGIDNAWIRYVSMGHAALRVIYIQKGSDVFLYRAGPHSVEDNLSTPRANATVISVTPPDPTMPLPSLIDIPNEAPRLTGVLGKFYENRRPSYIRNILLSRRFTKHKAVTLVSPSLTKGLLSVYSPFGKVLIDLIQEGTSIVLITKPPNSIEELKFFEKLTREKIDVYFHETVHAKLFIFEADPTCVEKHDAYKSRSVALIGSANLTTDGISIGESNDTTGTSNEELVYELPELHIPQVVDYVTYLAVGATDVPKQRTILTSQQYSNN